MTNEVRLYRGDSDETGKLEPDEYGLVYEVIVAKSRGQAKNEVCSQYDLPFTTQLSVRKIATDIEWEWQATPCSVWSSPHYLDDDSFADEQYWECSALWTLANMLWCDNQSEAFEQYERQDWMHADTQWAKDVLWNTTPDSTWFKGFVE
jgi:hypothetical protein